MYRDIDWFHVLRDNRSHLPVTYLIPGTYVYE